MSCATYFEPDPSQDQPTSFGIIATKQPSFKRNSLPRIYQPGQRPVGPLMAPHKFHLDFSKKGMVCVFFFPKIYLNFVVFRVEKTHILDLRG